ncbi:MAG: class I SAM-dependent methyltransferase [Saprospiraceae bacterium]
MIDNNVNMMTDHSKCLVCGSIDINKIKGYEKHYLTKCNQCSFVFSYRIPSAEELDHHYKVYAYSDGQYMSDVTKARYKELLQEFSNYRKTGRMLDVGCGAGNFLEVAKNHDWKVYGTEFSQAAVSHCKNKGINIKEGVLDVNDYEKESFDIITSFEVIEHINNPKEELEKFYKLLRPGGLLYCTTPNFNAISRYYLKEDYNIIQYPDHLSYYTNTTLHKLFSSSGLHKIKMMSTGISIDRIMANTTKKVKTKVRDSENTDEKLRTVLETNTFLKIAKWSLNKIFTVTKTGSTLKAYYEKPSAPGTKCGAH